jgi:hypothetical protein
VPPGSGVSFTVNPPLVMIVAAWPRPIASMAPTIHPNRSHLRLWIMELVPLSARATTA